MVEVLEGLVRDSGCERSLSLATDRVERILTLIKSHNVAIYNKKKSCRNPAPFGKGAKNVGDLLHFAKPAKCL